MTNASIIRSGESHHEVSLASIFTHSGCSMKNSMGIGFLLLTLIPTVATAQLSFTTKVYSSSVGVASVVSGDFNKDGILDLVTVGRALSFYRGLGGGRYASPVNTSLAHSYYQLVVADFNSDGKLDVAVLGSPVTIFLGKGDGNFRKGITISVPANAVSIAAADFNGDHIPDLVVSIDTGVASTTGTTEAFLGKGDGTFTKAPNLPRGGGQIVTGDFNADGHQDVAVITDQFTVAMLLGNGDGTFQDPLENQFQYPEFLTVGDFYNNRIQSLAVMLVLPTNISDQVFTDGILTARYLNGALNVSAPQTIGYSYSAALPITSGDLDGDFKDDIILTGFRAYPNSSGPQNLYMLGNGDGTFRDPVFIPHHGFENTPFVRDVNRDSRHDIIASWYTSTSSGPYLLLNTNATTNCTPPKPNALSVHICAPYNGQIVGKTFMFKAAGNAFNGTPKRMEIWIDGKKAGQKLDDQYKKSITLPVGKHSASFVVVDSFDHHVSKSVIFYVN
jgi:hypothetical protein